LVGFGAKFLYDAGVGIMAADPKLVLHQADNSHPNPKGSYLAACVFYTTLLDRNPVGLPASTFWRAEEYRQRYLEKRGLASCRTD